MFKIPDFNIQPSNRLKVPQNGGFRGPLEICCITKHLFLRQQHQNWEAGGANAALSALLCSLTLTAVPAQAQPPTQKLEAKRPAPPRRLPPNRSKPGGGLDPSAQTCGDSSSALTALVPTQNPVLTATAHPTIFVYVPESAETVQSATFSLLSADAKQRLYQAKVPLTNAPGIVKIQLPQTPSTSLEIGKAYQWHFDVDCKSGSRTAHLNVNGWVTRVSSQTPQQPVLWYDTLANLAQRLERSPQDAEARDRWTTLLKSADLDNIPYPASRTVQSQVSIHP